MAEGEVSNDEILMDEDLEDIIDSKSPLSEESGNKSVRVASEIGNVWEGVKGRQVPGASGKEGEEG